MLFPNVGLESECTRLVLLTPADSEVPAVFQTVYTDRVRHNAFLSAMQRLRGAIYLEDGAIERSQLSNDGRHRLPVDDFSWHVLLTDVWDNVLGCARYRPHEPPVTFNKLGVRRSALAKCKTWGEMLRSAVEREIRSAYNRDLSYVEVGGWALHQAHRFTGEGLRIALASFSLGRLLGGCIGITTATRRNNSSSMLRRLGGKPLEIEGKELPKYFDDSYRCDMEILRFDSTNPNPRFSGLIEKLSDELVGAEVVCTPAQPNRAKYAGVPFPAEAAWPGFSESLSNAR